MSFPCSKCDRVFTTKQQCQRHEGKKVPCNAEKFDLFACDFCTKHFKSTSNKNQHHKICKMNPGCDTATHKLNDKDIKEITNIMREANLTKNEIKTLLKGGICNTTNNNTTNNNNTIVINNFGSENMERVTQAFIDQCVRSADGLQRLAKFIHFNDEYPEDKNIRRGSNTNKTLKIMENGLWIMADRNTTLTKVMMDKLTIMYKHFLEFRDTIPESVSEPFEKWYFATRAKSGQDFYNMRNELNACAMNTI